LKQLRVALAQINPTVGDLVGNAKKIISYIKKARRLKADIVAFPELALTGYPPEDLLLKPGFIRDNLSILDKISAASTDITAVVGFVDKKTELYNAAAIISNNTIIDVYHKKHLPNYGVFDEYRYFRAGSRFPVYNLDGMKIGVNICEDIWCDNGPPLVQSLSGAQLIININASPYHIGKSSLRESLLTGRVAECNAAIVYVNMIGGQDELIFDGGSLVLDNDGEILVRARYFREELITVCLEMPEMKKSVQGRSGRKLKTLLRENEVVDNIKIPDQKTYKQKTDYRNRKIRTVRVDEEVYSALVLGTKDYVRKNGFKGVVIGMSGGVDSALVTTIAVDALGRDNVQGIFMPSMYSSKESHEDAHNHAKNLGITISTISINNIYDAYIKTLSKPFKGTQPDITEENLQARIRGNILMALSNKFGWLVLTTGNKSEMSVGYATLYGDMAGGFAVIKDVPKTLVYDLCQWRNKKARYELIPGRILWKEPTAELKPDQKDTDSLPPYSVLDPILKKYVEEHRGLDEITHIGCDVKCVRRVINMVDRAEYKRRQAPPGIKITPRAFGKDRRFPITNKYRNY
jgi:NAD+ synthase (glutamine-hydrolysing)